MYMLLAIGAGGALGSVARYLLATQLGQWFGSGFPWGTLVVNVLGGIAMGALAQGLPQSAAPELRAFLAIGVLGGFTTFSAFSLDVVHLAERGEMLAAAGYVGASVILSVLGLLLGMAVIRATLA